MQVFGADVDFFQFQMEGEDTVYKIPLATSMTNKEVLAFRDADNDYEKQIAWLRSYIGDIVDDLTVKQTINIIKAWSDASSVGGVSVGES